MTDHVDQEARFWRVGQENRGRDRVFKDPLEFRDACIEYFDWCHDNPIPDHKAHTFMGSVIYSSASKPRVFTRDGLCRYIGISRMSWQRWRAGEYGDELRDICDWAEGVIYDQKFAYGAAGVLNTSIISRDLGLVDKQDVHNTGTITQVQYTAEDYKQAQLDLDSKLDGLD